MTAEHVHKLIELVGTSGASASGAIQNAEWSWSAKVSTVTFGKIAASASAPVRMNASPLPPTATAIGASMVQRSVGSGVPSWSPR